MSYCSLTFSPLSAAFKKRTMSRFLLYGSLNGMPFQRSTITSDEVPRPKLKRPGAASAIVATHMASVAGPRVNDGTIAVPSWSSGAQAAVRASGVKPSVPLVSAVQTSE